MNTDLAAQLYHVQHTHTYPPFWSAAQRDTAPAPGEVCPVHFESGAAESVGGRQHRCVELMSVQIRLASFSQGQQTKLQSPVPSPKRKENKLCLGSMVGNKLQFTASSHLQLLAVEVLQMCLENCYFVLISLFNNCRLCLQCLSAIPKKTIFIPKFRHNSN